MPPRRAHKLSCRTVPLILCGSVLLLNTAHALPSDQNQPVSLEADRATYNERTGITTYTGNVLITQGTIKIEADSIVVNLTSNRGIKDATAQGRPARFQQQISNDKGIARGEGQRVVYDAQAGIVTLTGNALLTQDGAKVLQSGADVPSELRANVTIDTISYTAEGAVQLGGRGQGAAFVRLYLDGKDLSTLEVAADGQWTATLLEIEPGIYTLRADQIDSAGKVTSRFETPFKRETIEALMAAAAPPVAPMADEVAGVVVAVPALDAKPHRTN